ncbi:helix-turn-helix transcriptional regulator [Streptomyces sp. SP18CS02]|uniref:helix-turn-helix transcriptional regulator n=1 Tax=Streptomyces sp. SP18CS02 TaxID=3002531 RepID=UPI002E7A4276|nr:PAS domain-containing protein [Streptomyces sp. SP18CS02]MEE1754882.1 PAS domain-containing protein [Streptomyces sp. SP18CS02]
MDTPQDILDKGDLVDWRNRALLVFDRVPVPAAVCRTDGVMLLANPAMATEWGTSPGRLPGRNVLELFHPSSAGQVHRIVEAVRLGHRSRYPMRVHWSAPDDRERYGELTADTVSDSADAPLWLLVLLKVLGDREPPRRTPEEVSPAERRILALAAGGATTERIARSVGLTVDGVNYHLTRLSRRWDAPNRAALVARAYVLGVLAPGVWPPAPG